MYKSTLNILLFLSTFFISNYVIADVKSNKANSSDSEIVYELTDLDQIRDALAEYSRAEDKNNAIYEQKRRAMLDSVELRFLACDTDADDTLDVFEIEIRLPRPNKLESLKPILDLFSPPERLKFISGTKVHNSLVITLTSMVLSQFTIAVIRASYK